MNTADLHPLFAPSPWWSAAGLGAVILGLLLAGWPLLAALWRLSERRRTSATVPEQVRLKFAARIDGIEEAWEAQEISPREVAHRLGEVVRDFAHAAWGIRVDHMTLRELRSQRIEPIARAVAHLYEAEFSRTETVDCSSELQTVRELVNRWS